MKVWILLRIASISFLSIFLGHTMALLKPSERGPAEETILQALKGYQFPLMGSVRSHFDFYLGSSWVVSIFMIVLVALLWILSQQSKKNPRSVLGLIVVIFLGSLPFTAICWLQFFAVPGIAATISTLALFAAVVQIRQLDEPETDF